MAKPALLRPISIVEILDRAIDLSAKRISTFAAILAVSVVPGLILTGQNGGQIYVFAEIADRVGLTVISHEPHVAHSTAAFAIASLLEFIVGPLVGAALFISISSCYLTTRSSITGAYRAVGGSVFAILSLNALCAIPTFVVSVVNDEAMRIAENTLRLGFFAVPFAGFFVLSTILFAESLAMCAVLYEGAHAGRALWSALRRLSAPRRLVRTFGSLLLTFIVVIGTAVAHDAVWRQLPKYHVTNTLVVATIAWFPDFITAIVLSAFIVIFYYDVRVREEGFDLRIALDAIGWDAMPARATRST